jgi:A/G-specific adenine glycosylase
MKPTLSDAAWKQNFRRRLLAWFRRHGRELPWRQVRDPYLVWISEIMLQQTQVATVIPYFARFVSAFPTIDHLAQASEEQVLRLWEGLGYYRRARQLHRAAREIVQRHDGQFPTEFDQVRSLPGIGRYTAGAILSIASDVRVPILEANTIRLFSRLIGYTDDPTSRAGQEILWQFAEEILPAKKPGEFNQALMDLGSLICTPRNPSCTTCPAAALCPTFATGRQTEIPALKKPKNYESTREACVAVWRRGKVLLRKCGDDERWSGLWDFPRFVLQSSPGIPQQLREGVKRLCRIDVIPGQQLTTIKHGVTRFRITLECYRAEWRQGASKQLAVQWIEPRQLERIPLTMTARKFSRLLVASD